MHLLHRASLALFFFFNDTATTEIYTLSLHDALPISASRRDAAADVEPGRAARDRLPGRLAAGARQPGVRQRLQDAVGAVPDRKSTRLNSSHGYISYAVFCLKKKTKTFYNMQTRVIDD